MNRDSKGPSRNGPPQGPLDRPAGHLPVSRDDPNLQREKAEEREVAGRHKNSGQKDHKGAR